MIENKVKLILEVEMMNTMKTRMELVAKQSVQVKQFVSELKRKSLLGSEIDLEGQNYTVKNHLGNPIDINQRVGLLVEQEDGYRCLVIQNLHRSNIELPNGQQQVNDDNKMKQICLAVLTNNVQRLKSIYHDSTISEADLDILSKVSVQAQKEWTNKQDNHENEIKQLKAQIKEKQQMLQRKSKQNESLQQIIRELKNFQYRGQKYMQTVKIEVLNQVQQIHEKLLWAQSLSIQSQILKMWSCQRQSKQIWKNMQKLLKQNLYKIPMHMNSLYFHPQPPANFLSIIPLLPVQQNLLIMMHIEMRSEQKKEQKLFCIFINEKLIPSRKTRQGLLFNLLTGRSYQQHKNKNLCCYTADLNQLVILDQIMTVKNGKIQVKKKIFLCGQTEVNQVFKEGDIWNVNAIQILSVHLQDIDPDVAQ